VALEIVTPLGASVKASSQVRIVVYHAQFQLRQAFIDDFRMIGESCHILLTTKHVVRHLKVRVPVSFISE
jgi:hypothetical protein